MAQNFARLVVLDKNNDLVLILKEDAPRMQQLADAFSNILRDRSKTDQNIEVVFFYEEFATGPLGHIVAKNSATDEGHEAQAIPADHTSMAQFGHDAEASYVRIKVVLERWIRALKKTGKATPATGINIRQHIQRMMGGSVVGVVVRAI